MSFTPSWSAPLFVDGDYTSAVAVGLPVLSAPIPGVVTEYLLTQKFQRFRANWADLALNTLHPDYKVANGWTRDFYLVEEGPREDISGGIVEWTRTYAAVPAQHNEWETFAYSFTGLPVALSVYLTANIGRDRRSDIVTSRLQHDYFLVDGSTIATPGAIAVIWPMPYCYQYVSGGTTYGGTVLPADQLTPGNTVPSYGQAGTQSLTRVPPDYESMMADAVTNGWNAGVTNIIYNADAGLSVKMVSGGGTGYSSFGGQIPVETSRLTRWKGNIWLRQTRYVLCQ